MRHGTELNFTTGDKNVIEGSSLRWLIPEEIFSIFFEDKKVKDILLQGCEEGHLSYDQKWKNGNGVPKILLFDQNFYKKQLQPVLISLFMKTESSKNF